MRSTRLGIVAAAALLTLATACGGGGPEAAERQVGAAAEAAPEDVTALGGQATLDAMTALYEAAQAAGEDAVIVYGPTENDRTPLYEMFQQRFPGIAVRGEYLVGPDFAGRVNGEFASGQHVGDLAQAGDTAVAAQLAQDRFEQWVPENSADVSADFTDGEGHLVAASAAAFGIVYNTNEVPEADAPAGWEDLTDPAWRGRMAAEDPTRTGGAFSTLSHLLYDGSFDAGYLDRLAANEISPESSAAAAGTKVATGEFALNPFYPYSFYLRDKDKGAPVNFVFPMEGGNHLSGQFLGVFTGAPHPNAAKLLATWLFTPEAQAAAAEVGLYPTVPGTAGPSEYPPVDELDLLKPFPLAAVGQITEGNLAIVQQAFGGG